MDNDGVPDVRPTAELPAVSDDPAAATANRRLDDAREAFRAGQYAQAQELAEAAIKDLPSDATLHEFRALTLFAQQKYKESAAALYAVLSAGPGWDWETLRGLYPDAATYTAQLRNLEAAVKNDPRSGAGHFLLGYHYLVLGDKAAAVSQLQEVTRAQPSDKLAAALLKSLTTASADAPPAPGQ